MKTTFSMLWVDDRPKLIEALELRIKDWLDEKGFELKIKTRTDGKNVIEDIIDRNIELIIVDNNLPGANGDEIIKLIRDNGCYQDIIYYSEGELPNVILNGVFYVRKVDAEQRIKELIELKLWRISDPSSVRGWILADSIELEDKVMSLLERCFLERKGYTFARRFFYDHTAPIDFGRKVDILKGILNDLVEWLEKQPEKEDDRITNIRKCNEVYKSFKEEIVEIRNAIAHQRLEGNIIKKKTKDATPIILDESTLIKIRNDFRKHYKNLEVLEKFL